ELEYGCDDAFLLVADARGDAVALRHLKSRHGEARDIPLTFDRRLQRFAAPGESPRDTGVVAALGSLRNQTPPANGTDSKMNPAPTTGRREEPPPIGAPSSPGPTP